MRKIGLFAVAAALALAGIGAWAASSGHARVDVAAEANGIDPSQIMLHARDLPIEEFVDYSLVYN
jgi:hypothetical protein